MREKLVGKPPRPLEIQFKRKGEAWMWLQISGRALWEHGMAAGVQVVAQDITEHKRMEEELLRLSNAVSISPDGITISDMDGKIIYVNQATLDMFGTDNPKDLLGKVLLTLSPPTTGKRRLLG